MRCLPLVLVLAACAAPERAQPAQARSPRVSHAAQSDPSAKAGAEAAPAFTRSPVRELDSDVDAAFAGLCPHWDAALSRVAERLLDASAARAPLFAASNVEHALREEGSPYVWPHAWSAAGRGRASESAPARFSAWLTSFGDGGERRCGIATRTRADGFAIAAVAADALADLAPLPTRVRPGSWVDVEATFLVRVDGAKVVVLGPRGAPKPVPTSLETERLRARFAADVAGRWVIQVVATVEGGPRQVLEAELVAGEGALRDERAPAPGEDIAGDEAEPNSRLARMLDRARESEGLTPLSADSELTRLAQAQAEALRRARRVAHDLGDGDPESRVQSAGVMLSEVGENVAHAEDVARAHRALWSSPSHRTNILSSRFDRIGIGVARDADGSVWVCELFGRFAR